VTYRFTALRLCADITGLTLKVFYAKLLLKLTAIEKRAKISSCVLF